MPVCEVNLSTPDLHSVSSASTPSVVYDPVVGMKIGTRAAIFERIFERRE